MEKSANGGLDGLALLSTIGRILDAVDEDYAAAIEAVATACVPAFADLCAIEVIAANGESRTTASQAMAGSGLLLTEPWGDLMHGVAGVSEPVVGSDAVGDGPLEPLRVRLGAGSIVVAPIVAGDATPGWFLAATGASRPRFAASALAVGGDVGRRIGATIQRVALHQRLQASAREQGRVAHDLNNLLTLILGYSDLLGRGITDPHLASLAAEIGGAARRAAGLTQEMLDSSSSPAARAPGPTAGDSAAAASVPPGDGPAGAESPGLTGTSGAGPAAAGPVAAVSPGADVDSLADSPDPGTDDGDGWAPGRTMAGRILYVEDEPGLRRAGQDYLVTAGLDVVAAESAERALAILEGDSFDALVTDIALPGLTGVQLVRAVRRTHPDVRVLYVTGYSGVPDPDHTPGPSDPVVRKPYRPDTLRLRVAELLERPESRGSEPVHGS